MNASELRECGASIQQPVSTQGSAGGYTQTWSVFATRRMKVKPLSARQRWLSSKLEHHVTHEVTLRYLDGVTHDMRIVLRSGKILHIRGMINVDEQNVWLQLLCEEGVGS